MNHPPRHEIEKFANDAFAIDRDRILTEYAEKKSRVLGQVRLTGNSGGYLPALVTWAAERERALALARADAWGRAFTLFGEPSDAEAEEALKTDSRLSGAGSISAIRDELHLRSVRLRIAEEGQGMPWHLEIERPLDSALKEGVLRLMQQRIMAKDTDSLLCMRSPSVNPANGATKERASAMVVFNSRPATIVRGAGTPEELRWETRMGGDFDANALFQASDRVVTGDEVYCDVFDQPRIVRRVKPVFASGELAFWEAAIIPRPEGNGPHSASLPMIHAQRPVYPKSMFHATKPSVMVYSAQQQAALGTGWSDQYIFQPYPKRKHHWTKKERIVQNLEEEVALGGGWGDSPNDFAPYRDASPARSEQQAPLKWVDTWTVPGLSSNQQNAIKAQLLRADAAFWKLPDADSADLTSMRLAFDGVARVLFEAGILTEQLLRDEIPVLIWDSAIAGGWYRLAAETPGSIFPEHLGHYWVWRDESKDWKGLFRSETAKWLAELLETSPPAKSLPGSVERARPRNGGPQMKPVRRNEKYERIDKALREFAAARPTSHEEVFRLLDSRKVAIPSREPFKSAGGWLKGFQQDHHSASAWLSQVWGKLRLPAFPRGPKK